MLAPHDGRRALECLAAADAVLRGEDPAATPARSREQAVADYARASGHDLDDPEFQARAYRAVAEIRRQELERQGKLAEARARAAVRRARPTRRPPTKPKPP